ncbi:MAG TPA: N,N-dimethylformamidase beta subunit family domain-containing protein, partial [Gaiellaceae bacterium]|nr:N,N-dimethylformamidase beta subunit family domain-containing protein [Gaiellaceae bacterium]
RPECELEGVEYSRANGVESIGGNHDYSVVPGSLSDPWFAHTGFTASSTLPGIVGYEWDAVQPGCRTGTLTVFFHFAGPPAPSDAVRMQAPSGALVFSAGSLTFSRGLDDFRPHAGLAATGDPRLEVFMRNALADLLRPPGPVSVRISAKAGSVLIRVVRAPDPRVRDVRIFRAPAVNPLARGSRGMRFVCRTPAATCVDRAVPAGRSFRYVVVIRDRWGSSTPFVTPPVTVPG